MMINFAWPRSTCSRSFPARSHEHQIPLGVHERRTARTWHPPCSCTFSAREVKIVPLEPTSTPLSRLPDGARAGHVSEMARTPKRRIPQLGRVSMLRSFLPRLTSRMHWSIGGTGADSPFRHQAEMISIPTARKAYEKPVNRTEVNTRRVRVPFRRVAKLTSTYLQQRSISSALQYGIAHVSWMIPQPREFGIFERSDLSKQYGLESKPDWVSPRCSAILDNFTPESSFM